jgi:hypothetical protein
VLRSRQLTMCCFVIFRTGGGFLLLYSRRVRFTMLAATTRRSSPSIMTSSGGYTNSLKRPTFVTTRFAFLRIRSRAGSVKRLRVKTKLTSCHYSGRFGKRVPVLGGRRQLYEPCMRRRNQGRGEGLLFANHRQFRLRSRRNRGH